MAATFEISDNLIVGRIIKRRVGAFASRARYVRRHRKQQRYLVFSLKKTREWPLLL